MAMFPALMNDTTIYAMDSSGRVLTEFGLRSMPIYAGSVTVQTDAVSLCASRLRPAASNA